MSQDLMERIGKLLMHAEGTKNQAEKDLYLSKAQNLATLASIDLASALNSQKHKTERETPIREHIKLFDYSDKSHGKASFVELISAIGYVNDLTFDISQTSHYVIAYGYPSDIAVTKALYNNLSVQMVRDSEAFLKTGAYRNETMTVERPIKDYWGGTEYVTVKMDGRVARRSFYNGFRAEVTKRLRAAREEAIKAFDATVPEGATVDATEPQVGADMVLVNKAKTVHAFYKEASNAKGSWRGGGYRSGSSSAGTGAGRESGSRANIGSNAAIGGKREIG